MTGFDFSAKYYYFYESILQGSDMTSVSITEKWPENIYRNLKNRDSFCH
jgi:hypothetical protein